MDYTTHELDFDHDAVPISSHPFVQFAHQQEQCDALVEALAGLQQRHHLNPHICLFTVWYARASHGRLRKSDFKHLHSVVQPWNERIYLGLQRLLTILKRRQQKNAMNMRALIQREINTAKGIEQQMLTNAVIYAHQGARNDKQQLRDACHNLLTYFKYKEMSCSAEDTHALEVILQSVFNQSHAATIQNELANAHRHVKLDAIDNSQLSLIEM